MKLKVCNMDGKSVGDVSLDASLLEERRGGQAVHDAVVAYQANQRAGTASTKTKGTVAGSNKKPWKQKGTGRARAGYRQSPIWRGGGVAFGPHPRKYTKDMPRKVAKLAFRRAFTDRAAAGDLVVVDKFEISAAKTKAFVAALGKLKIEGSALIVLDTITRDVALASRNVPGIDVTTAANINTFNLMKRGKIVISQPALDQLALRLKGGGSVMKQPYTIVKKLSLTEKGARLTEKDNKYLFQVHADANKGDIKRSVEALFRVSVTKVNTLNRLGKMKRNRMGGVGTTSAWKRAIVTLKAGDKIEMGT